MALNVNEIINQVLNENQEPVEERTAGEFGQAENVYKKLGKAAGVSQKGEFTGADSQTGPLPTSDFGDKQIARLMVAEKSRQQAQNMADEYDDDRSLKEKAKDFVKGAYVNLKQAAEEHPKAAKAAAIGGGAAAAIGAGLGALALRKKLAGMKKK